MIDSIAINDSWSALFIVPLDTQNLYLKENLDLIEMNTDFRSSYECPAGKPDPIAKIKNKKRMVNRTWLIVASWGRDFSEGLQTLVPTKRQ
jgi:hypothetical protein